MDPSSVYELLTQLCTKIPIDHGPSQVLGICASKNKSRSRYIVKKLRALCYEILLHKSTIPTYEVGKGSTLEFGDEFEFIKDPAVEILARAIPLHGCQPTTQITKLKESMEYIMNDSELSEDPTIQAVLELLLNLADEAPVDEPYKSETGWFNTGYKCPCVTKSIADSSTVKPYTHYGREMSEPILLERAYEAHTKSDGHRYRSCTERINLRFFEPLNGSETGFADTCYGRLLPVCQATRPSSFINLQMDSAPMLGIASAPNIGISERIRERCSTSSSVSAERDYNTSSADLDDSPMNELRTWESVGDLDPKKNSLHLMEIPDPSIVNMLMLYEKTNENPKSVKKMNMNVVGRRNYVSDLKYMLMGIGSTTFSFDQALKLFVSKEDTCIDGLSSQTLSSSVKDLIACGSYCYRLNELTGSSTNLPRGRIFDALCLSIERYLTTYKAVIMNINENASVLGITVRLKKLVNQLRSLACLCKLDSATPLPFGVDLLAHLYDEIMVVTNPDLTCVLISVLHDCVTAYLSFLHKWLFEGSCCDPYHEFFVESVEKFSGERTRLYWKKAYVKHNGAVPGFLTGLEKPIFETGKALNLLKLCNPNDNLLKAMDERAPRLRFTMKMADLASHQAEYEAHYQRAVGFTGKPVTASQLLERSRDQERDLQERVKLVSEQRMAAYKANCEARALRLAAAKQAELLAWRDQIKMSDEYKEKEKKKERELEEEVLRRSRLLQAEERATIEEEKQNIRKHYDGLLEVIEQRKQYAEKEMARERLAAAKQDTRHNEEATLDQTSSSPDDLSTPSKSSPCYNDLPTPNGNSQIDINSCLDNYPLPRGIIDNNRLNNEEDVQNRNIDSLGISTACDNIMPVIETDTGSKITEAISQIEERKARTERLSLDFNVRNETALSTRKKVMNEESLFARPWDVAEKEGSRHKRATEMSPEEYARLAVTCSRKASATRIRNRMLGIDTFTPIKLSKSSEIALTAQQIKGKVLETEYGIVQSPALEQSKTDLQRNRAKVLDSEFNLVTGVKKVAREPLVFSTPIQSSCEKSHDVEIIVDTKHVISPTSETSPINAMPVSNSLDSIASTNRVDYSRCESLISNISMGVTPSASCLSGMNTGSSYNSTVNPFFKSVPQYNRTYSFSPYVGYDSQVQEQLSNMLGNIESNLSLPSDDSDIKESVFDVNTRDMAAINDVLKTAMIIPVRTQMKLANDAILRFFLVDQDLLSHLQSLRDYFFLLDGEFGRTVTLALFERLNESSKPHQFLNLPVLNLILSRALTSTVDRQSKNGKLLSFTIREVPRHFTHAAPHVLSCLNLSYVVEWPLNILITEEIMSKYQQVFEFLLKLRRVSWTLEEEFVELKQVATDRSYSRSLQYKRVQLFRHVMSHLMQALHNYVTSTVLQESWCDLQHDLKEAMTVDDIYHAHVLYIKTVLLRCLLGSQGKADNFQKHLSNIFTLVLKFDHQLNIGRWHVNVETKLSEHSLFNSLQKIFKLFQQQAGSLVRLSKKLASRGHYSHLFELLQKLNMNDYYERQTVEGK